MIEIYAWNDGISISGHAYYDEPGKDIVCAAVTALTQTLIESLERLAPKSISSDVSSGRVDIYFRNVSENAKTLIDSFFIGIQMIAEEFPQYVVTEPLRQ